MKEKIRKVALTMLLGFAVAIAGACVWAQFYVAFYNGGRVNVFVYISRTSVVVGNTSIFSRAGLAVGERSASHYEGRLIPNSTMGGTEVPFYIPLLFILPLAGLLWQMKPLDPFACIHCNYNLTGNTSGICPECGATAKKPDASNATAPPRAQ